MSVFIKNPELILFSTTVRALHIYQKINSILCQTFILDNNFLFQTQGYQIGQWSIARDLKKRRNKAFFMIGCKHMGEIEYDLTETKKLSLIRHLLL